MAGAEYLQSIFGTEKDKVNCPFYFKMGACRHGDQCERKHLKPSLSQTLLLSGMFSNPILHANYDEKKAQEWYDDFYYDVYTELSKYGEIDEMHVCDNICEHLRGNVYVKFFRESDADKALKGLTGRFYGGKAVVAEFSPVTDFREASCRQFENRECTRGGHCNFMHLKQISRELHRCLFSSSVRRQARREKSPRREDRRERDRERKRSRSPRRDDRERSSRSEKRRSRSRSKDRRSRSPKKTRSDSRRESNSEMRIDPSADYRQEPDSGFRYQADFVPVGQQ